MFTLCTVGIDKTDKVFIINSNKTIPRLMFLRPKRFIDEDDQGGKIFVIREKRTIDCLTIFASSWIDGLYNLMPKTDDRIRGELDLIRAAWFEVGDELCVEKSSSYESFIRRNCW
jgi:hypothetical protein